jgi:hypothetical protein
LSRATLAGSGRERRVVATSVKLSVKVLRVTDPMLRFLTGNPVARTLLLAQFSVKPWALDGEVVLRELRSFLSQPRSTTCRESWPKVPPKTAR